MIVVPEEFARTTVEREGTAGAEWVEQLPALVDDLLTRWGCVLDGDVLHGGVGVIVPVRRPASGPAGPAAGAPAVLKVSFPHPGNVHEPDAFALWGGRGAVLLYERDDERFAMLLERARTERLADLGDREEALRVAGRISRRLTVPAPPGLPRLRDRADDWEQQLRRDADELTHGLPDRVVDAAVATVRELGRTQPETVVHGDFHVGNVLRADREPWLVVDPKGYVGDPAYDAGALLKSLAMSLITADDLRKALYRTVDVFAEAAELDRVRVHRWAQLHAVQAAFWGRRHGFHVVRSGPELDQAIAFADHVAGLLTDGT